MPDAVSFHAFSAALPISTTVVTSRVSAAAPENSRRAETQAESLVHPNRLIAFHPFRGATLTSQHFFPDRIKFDHDGMVEFRQPDAIAGAENHTQGEPLDAHQKSIRTVEESGNQNGRLEILIFP